MRTDRTCVQILRINCSLVENVKKKAGQEGKKKKLFCKKLFVGGKIISFLDVKKTPPEGGEKTYSDNFQIITKKLITKHQKTNIIITGSFRK